MTARLTDEDLRLAMSLPPGFRADFAIVAALKRWLKEDLLAAERIYMLEWLDKAPHGCLTETVRDAIGPLNEVTSQIVDEAIRAAGDDELGRATLAVLRSDDCCLNLLRLNASMLLAVHLAMAVKKTPGITQVTDTVQVTNTVPPPVGMAPKEPAQAPAIAPKKYFDLEQYIGSLPEWCQEATYPDQRRKIFQARTDGDPHR